MALLADGRGVTWEELGPLMAEAAGGAVLGEVVLDGALERRAREAGIVVSAAAVEAERGLLAQAARRAGAGPEALAASIERIRRERGLGERRFGALLRRSAILRALVGPEVKVEEVEVRQAWAARHGAKVAGRVIVADALGEATAALEKVRRAPAEHRAAAFADAAVEHSTDESALRGGTVEPFNLDDPAYPGALRAAAKGLGPGEMTGVVAMERGFAILLVERIIPADGVTFESARGELERDVRLVAERRAMDALARQILAAAGVTVLDRGLAWSWEGSAGAGEGAGGNR